MAISNTLLQEAATMAHGAAASRHVPEGLVWGTWVALHPNATSADTSEFHRIADTLSAVHTKTGKWDSGVLAASGGKVTDQQATAIQAKLPAERIMLGDFPGQSIWQQIAHTLGMSAVPVPGIQTGALAAGEAGGAAGAEGAAAGGAAGGAGAAGAGAAAAGAAGLSTDLIAGGLIAAVVAFVTGYGLRLLELIAGGALVLFGLATLAKGGDTPNLPKAVPV